MVTDSDMFIVVYGFSGFSGFGEDFDIQIKMGLYVEGFELSVRGGVGDGRDIRDSEWKF